ncbi:MAG: phosphatidylinositol-3-phosphatase, partial [Actinomycetota bacterium]|nr:phosphatidylinositol-3-phosphatase [Actinomycetota bacterium]
VSGTIGSTRRAVNRRRRALAGVVALGLLAACAGEGRTSTRAGTSEGTADTTPTRPAPDIGPSPAIGADGPSTTAGSAPPPEPAIDPSSPCGARTAAPARYDHVVWIWMENKTYDEVIGNPSAPYETSVAQKCGTATAYAIVGKPSLPNYIGATSGDTHGIDDNDGPASHPLEVDNIFRQVRHSDRRAVSYQESMPGNCAMETSEPYAVKHNPAPYYVGGGDRVACLVDNVPLGALDGGPLADALDNDTLPAFSFVTPNQCSDTHDCPVATGDQWLELWLTRILASGAYRSGTTAVFVVWDEPTPMPHIVISPTTPPGTTSATGYDHYSLLRTTEELLGISELLGHANTAASMRSAFGL